MTINEKVYTILVYRNAGAFIDTISDFEFSGPIRETINSGQGQFSFTLPQKGDNYGEGTLIDYNNLVQLVCVDTDNSPNGEVIYTGEISSFGPQIDEATESILVNCFGYLSLMADSELRSGTTMAMVTSGTGLTAATVTGGVVNTGTATAVETVFKAIIDLYRANSTYPIANYNSASIGTTGNSMNYSFFLTDWKSALDICLQNCPAGWYYYMGADNLLVLQPKPSTPTHYVTLSKDFQNLDALKNSENIANHIIVKVENTTIQVISHYTDASSVAAYGDRWLIHEDSNLLDQASIDQVGNSLLAANKDPKVKINVTIDDNNGNLDGYDIEKIHPGDTIQVLNYNQLAGTSFPSNMQVVAKDYYPTYCQLELEQLNDTVANSIVDALQASSNQGTINPALITLNTSSAPAVHSFPGMFVYGFINPSNVPAGWVIPSGQVISNAYSPFNGMTLFNAVGAYVKGTSSNPLSSLVTGGASSHAHTVNGHYHGISADGAHTHGGGTDTQGYHNHTGGTSNSASHSGAGVVNTVAYGGSTDHYHTFTTDGNGNHTHNISTDNPGNYHSHGGATGYASDNGMSSANNDPVFFGLVPLLRIY